MTGPIGPCRLTTAPRQYTYFAATGKRGHDQLARSLQRYFARDPGDVIRPSGDHVKSPGLLHFVHSALWL